jgi:hypothetical protein
MRAAGTTIQLVARGAFVRHHAACLAVAENCAGYVADADKTHVPA